MSADNNSKINNNGTVSWRCPSNIAIVKYWGKHGVQLPRNPSISFTLTNAYSETSLHFSPNETEEFTLTFLLDGKLNEKFGDRTKKYFSSIKNYFPFIEDYNYVIESKNTFPHSSGIASSASGMGALAMCLCEMEAILHNREVHIDRQKASIISRLGSGSACRSIFPYMGLWGKTTTVANSSDDYAIPYLDIHDVFKSYHDDILIVSSGEKEVSSSIGHALMEDNIYAESRYYQANININNLLPILKNGDLDAFGEIAESEAMTLHALMMCSTPSFILMQPNTLSLIHKIRTYRKDTKLPLYFTLDAGPNIHLLYPNEIESSIKDFIQEELKPLCQRGLIIEDIVGKGPDKVI
jgi:diphosphomevalonate decarboxylase